MKGFFKALENNFVIVNLGSGGDLDYNLSDELRASTILVEIDAADDSKGSATYLRKEKLNKTIAGSKGTHRFRVNNYVACSSLREPSKKLISRYGLDNYYKINREEEVECTTLPILLAEHNIERVDFLKTDLEGEDFAIIKSMESYLDDILAIQCELRFEPFYEGEPYINEVIEYLRKFNFELIGLRPEFWKPVTKHSHMYDDGRIVWADCLFLKNLEADKSSKQESALQIAKQIIILSMLGRKGYASYLESEFGYLLPTEWHSDIIKLLEPDSDSRSKGKKLIRSVLNKFGLKTQTLEDSEFKFNHLAKR